MSVLPHPLRGTYYGVHPNSPLSPVRIARWSFHGRMCAKRNNSTQRSHTQQSLFLGGTMSGSPPRFSRTSSGVRFPPKEFRYGVRGNGSSAMVPIVSCIVPAVLQWLNSNPRTIPSCRKTMNLDQDSVGRLGSVLPNLYSDATERKICFWKPSPQDCRLCWESGWMMVPRFSFGGLLCGGIGLSLVDWPCCRCCRRRHVTRLSASHHTGLNHWCVSVCTLTNEKTNRMSPTLFVSPCRCSSMASNSQPPCYGEREFLWHERVASRGDERLQWWLPGSVGPSRRIRKLRAPDPKLRWPRVSSRHQDCQTEKAAEIQRERRGRLRWLGTNVLLDSFRPELLLSHLLFPTTSEGATSNQTRLATRLILVAWLA